MRIFLLNLVLTITLAFPPLPKTATMQGVEPLACGDFMIWATYFDYNGDDKTDRTEYSTQDDVLFAVTLWDVKTHQRASVHILVGDKVHVYKGSDKIPVTPCDVAERIRTKKQAI